MFSCYFKYGGQKFVSLFGHGNPQPLKQVVFLAQQCLSATYKLHFLGLELVLLVLKDIEPT